MMAEVFNPLEFTRGSVQGIKGPVDKGHGIEKKKVFFPAYRIFKFLSKGLIIVQRYNVFAVHGTRYKVCCSQKKLV